MYVNLAEYSSEPCGLGLPAQCGCVLTRPPQGTGAEGSSKHRHRTIRVVFEKFSFSLESATVFYLRSLQLAVFGRRLLPFLVVAG